MPDLLRRLALVCFVCLSILAPGAKLLAQDATPTGPTPEEIRQMQEDMMEAQMEAVEALGEAGGVIAGGVVMSILSGLIFSAVIYAVCALLIFLPYSKVPAEHQKISPPMVFLMAIPLFNYVWNFIATARVSESFKSLADATGDTTAGDAGKALGLWFSICAVASFGMMLTCILLPLSPLAGLAALVLFIIYDVKLWGMAGKITNPGAGAPPAAPPTA